MKTENERLLQMCDDFEKYKESHAEMKEFQEKFYQSFITHEENEAEKFTELMRSQADLTKVVVELSENTKGIVQLHRDFQGAAHVGVGLQKFLVWLTKLGVIGSGLAYLIKIVLDNCHPPPG